MIINDTVLRNDWIVACKIEDVKEEPIQRIIMGERVVIFRNEQEFMPLRIYVSIGERHYLLAV